MTPSDWAAWVQAVGSIIGIAVAIWVPLQIHIREQSAAQQSKHAYRTILGGVLRDLQLPLGFLIMFRQGENEQDEKLVGAGGRKATPEQRRQAAEIASDMEATIAAMTQAASILDELETINGIDSFEVIRAVFHLRRKLREYLPLIEREAHLLDEAPTPRVVEIAIEKLNQPANELLEAVNNALQALRARS